MTANQQHGRGNIGRNYYVVIGPKLHHPEIAPGAAYLRALHLQPPPDRAQNADRIARHISDTTSVRPPWSHLPWRLGPPHLAFQEHRFVRRTVLPPDSAKPPCVCVAQIFICASPWYDCPYRSHTWNGFSFWPTFHHHHHTSNTHTSTSTVLRAGFFSPLSGQCLSHTNASRVPSAAGWVFRLLRSTRNSSSNLVCPEKSIPLYQKTPKTRGVGRRSSADNRSRAPGKTHRQLYPKSYSDSAVSNHVFSPVLPPASVCARVPVCYEPFHCTHCMFSY